MAKDKVAYDKNMSTSDRILFVAIELMAERGYKSVTIDEIAKKADVSQMTVFRHFGNKKQMLEDAVDRFYYPIPMHKVFEEKIVYDLRKDLIMVSQSYHELMKKNVKLVRIAYKEGSSIPGLLERVNKHPRLLKELLVKYFIEMQEMGKLKKFDVEKQAMLFLYINYGQILSRTFVEGHRITSISENEIIESSVDLFADALSL